MNSTKQMFNKETSHFDQTSNMTRKNITTINNNGFSLKNKLVTLNNNINILYKEIDQNKLDLNTLKIENEKMNEFITKKIIKTDNKLKESLDNMKSNTEDKFSIQKTNNRDYITHIKLLKEDHISLNNTLSKLQKRLEFLASHVGLEALGK